MRNGFDAAEMVCVCVCVREREREIGPSFWTLIWMS